VFTQEERGTKKRGGDKGQVKKKHIGYGATTLRYPTASDVLLTFWHPDDYVNKYAACVKSYF
jgi:hypothetical protein